MSFELDPLVRSGVFLFFAFLGLSGELSSSFFAASSPIFRGRKFLTMIHGTLFNYPRFYGSTEECPKILCK